LAILVAKPQTSSVSRISTSALPTVSDVFLDPEQGEDIVIHGFGQAEMKWVSASQHKQASLYPPLFAS
jgi:hypothetical protein